MTKVISEVVIFDFNTGTQSTLIKVNSRIEAPNWMPSNDALVVNGGGALFRVPLDAPKLVRVDTGSLQALNNDHGVSPDGELFALTNRNYDVGAQIFTMPVAGGEPELISQGGSYWHGWSPDGQTLAYTARRDGIFDIHTIPAEGGQEVRLTFGFDHCDGPDYTPNGKWIWFNGERDGQVDLWRIPAEGGAPERMTDDERVNWFPHPSPDGRSVLYLAYPPGTEGHPEDLEVELRVMPQEGGRAETLVKLLGGQGTINVPCWSPDGQKFAFVRYAHSG
ncbi:MAG: hypothetical protein OXQ92_01350 [Boseongicola sp.]|nr:hypothetical protein [Boseongicola sp.]